MQKRFLHIAIRKYDFVEKRARKARERKPEKRESRKKKNLSTVFENVLKLFNISTGQSVLLSYVINEMLFHGVFDNEAPAT